MGTAFIFDYLNIQKIKYWRYGSCIARSVPNVNGMTLALRQGNAKGIPRSIWPRSK